MICKCRKITLAFKFVSKRISNPNYWKAIFLVIVILLLFSLVHDVYKENKVNKIFLGMSQEKAEQILGKGKKSYVYPVCSKCETYDTQFSYDGNASLWFGRLEDTIIICYSNNIACDMKRVSL